MHNTCAVNVLGTTICGPRNMAGCIRSCIVARIPAAYRDWDGRQLVRLRVEAAYVHALLHHTVRMVHCCAAFSN